MIEKHLLAIIEAENKGKEIINDGKSEYDKIILQGEEEIERAKEGLKVQIKKLRDDGAEKTKVDSQELYQNLIADKKNELEKEKAEILSKVEEVKKEITKEILDKWLL